MERQKQLDLFEFKAILVHIVSSRSTVATGGPDSKRQKRLIRLVLSLLSTIHGLMCMTAFQKRASSGGGHEATDIQK